MINSIRLRGYRPARRRSAADRPYRPEPPQIKDYLFLNKHNKAPSFVRETSPERLLVVEVAGDSVAPTIASGDRVISTPLTPRRLQMGFMRYATPSIPSSCGGPRCYARRGHRAQRSYSTIQNIRARKPPLRSARSSAKYFAVSNSFEPLPGDLSFREFHTPDCTPPHDSFVPTQLRRPKLNVSSGNPKLIRSSASDHQHLQLPDLYRRARTHRLSKF